MNYNDVLLNNDKKTANLYQEFINDKGHTWSEVRDFIGYPNDQFTSDGIYLTEHFRNTVLNIKILSLTGKHFSQYHNKKRKEIFGSLK